MGNTSNREQWAVRERLAFIERLAWWRGVVNRGDVRDVFGISAAQASSDLQAYQELNPTALAYNVKAKRYEAGQAMMCRLHEPRIEEAIRLFRGEWVPELPVYSGVKAEMRVDVFQPLVRRPDPAVERRVFLALDQNRRLTIRYLSLNSGKAARREIAPHALGHDGYRWHVRAWCFENEEYRDFAPSRMVEPDWPGEVFVPPVRDEDWERIEKLVLVPHSDLVGEKRRSIELDYGMTNGKLEVEVRSAMKEYFFAHCRIPVLDENGKPRPLHLELQPSQALSSASIPS